MKILIITFSFYPYSTVSAFRITRFAKYLPDEGIHPYIITARHSRKTTSSPPENTSNLKTDSLLENIIYKKTLFSYDYRSPINPVHFDKKRGFPAYSLNYLIRLIKDILLSPDKHIIWSLSIIPTACRLIKKERIRALLITGDPFSLFAAGLIIKRITKVKLILDYRDPWLSNRMNLLQTFVRRFINNKLQNLSLRNADIVVSVNQTILDELPVAESKKLLITNGFDPQLFEERYDGYDTEHSDLSTEPPAQAQGQAAVNSPKEFLFFYAGKVDISSAHYNPASFLQGYRLFREKHPSYSTRVIMYGEVTSQTKNVLQDEKLLDSVDMLGVVSPQEVINSGKKADALILFLFPESSTDKVSSKLFEYLRLKKPIISINSEHGSLAELLKKTNAGFSCENDDIESISRLLNKAYNLDKDYFRKGLNLELIESFNVRRQVKELSDRITSLFDS